MPWYVRFLLLIQLTVHSLSLPSMLDVVHLSGLRSSLLLFLFLCGYHFIVHGPPSGMALAPLIVCLLVFSQLVSPVQQTSLMFGSAPIPRIYVSAA